MNKIFSGFLIAWALFGVVLVILSPEEGKTCTISVSMRGIDISEHCATQWTK